MGAKSVVFEIRNDSCHSVMRQSPASSTMQKNGRPMQAVITQTTAQTFMHELTQAADFTGAVEQVKNSP